MIITKNINADLWIRERPQEISAVQGDVGTRKVSMHMYANREPWVPEGDVSIVIRYYKPDGTSGTYDTMPNGERAWELEENTVSFWLAPQLLAVPGRVEVQVEMLSGEAVLASFPICVLVERNVAAGVFRSQNYFSWVHRLELKLKEKLKEAKESGLFDGPVGATPKLQIGTVTTVEAGGKAGASVSGTPENPILDLALPRGQDALIDVTLGFPGYAADAAAVGQRIANLKAEDIGAVPARKVQNSTVSGASITNLNAFPLSVPGGGAAKFRIGANLLMYGKVTNTITTKVCCYAFSGYSEHRAPGVVQLNAGDNITVSTGGDNDNGWYIQVDNSSGSPASLYLIGNYMPTFI